MPNHNKLTSTLAAARQAFHKIIQLVREAAEIARSVGIPNLLQPGLIKELIQDSELARRLFYGGSPLHRFDKLFGQVPERLGQPLVEEAFSCLNADYLGDPQRWIARLSLLPETSFAKGIESNARAWAMQTPEEAIEWANRLPQDRRLDAGGEAFAEWRRSQPDAATKWLNDLPPGDQRRLPYFQSAVRVLAWDPQSAEQLAALTASERAAARSVVETMPLSEDRRATLLDALK